MEAKGYVDMSDGIRITGRVIAAARALAGIGQEDFATVTGIPVETLCRIEASGSAPVASEPEAESLIQGLDHFGVILIKESNGMGAGVRLKFTRQDVRQVTRLEGEGGISGADDAP